MICCEKMEGAFDTGDRDGEEYLSSIQSPETGEENYEKKWLKQKAIRRKLTDLLVLDSIPNLKKKIK